MINKASNNFYKTLLNNNVIDNYSRSDRMTANAVGDRDSYTKSKKTFYLDMSDITYSSKSKYIPDSLLFQINDASSSYIKSGEYFHYAGFTFTSSQVPRIDTKNLSEIKAHNNVIDFGQHKYFKYVDKNGIEHPVISHARSISQVISERMRGGEYDPVVNRYARFWRAAAEEYPVYMGMKFSRAEIKSYLAEAGIGVGFFTIKMGDKEVTHFHTNSKSTGIIMPKQYYDDKYNYFTKPGCSYFKNYEPGTIVKFGGKEYTIKDDYSVNMPYGEDVFDFEFPKIKLRKSSDELDVSE